MKLKRKHLTWILAGLAFLLVGYSVLRGVFHVNMGENLERYLYDVIVIGALGVFMYNRKLAKDEAKERAAEKEKLEEEVQEEKDKEQ
jgi:hypothetical protein